MGFPEPILDAAFGPDTVDRQRRTVVHLRREAHQLRHEADLVRADPTGGAEADATATVLDLRAAEIEQRIDGVERVS